MSRISEQFFTEGFTEDRIDEAAGVIKRVRILGKESKNGRTYSKAAMQSGRGLYEGAEVNIDHARDEPTSRDFAEGFGEIRAVTYQEKGDDYWLEGDLHYLKSHPMAPRVVERARRFPEKVGLSHVIDGTSNRVNGKTNVESIDSVISVDVVTRPATNKSFFESEDEMPTETKKTTLRALLEKAWPGRKHRDLIEEAEDAAGMAPSAEVPAPSGGSSEDAVKAAFRAMVVAAFDDEKLDSKATLNRIKDILKSQEKLMGGGSSSAPPADGGGSGDSGSEGPKAEAMEKRLDKLERLLTEREEKAECRELLAEANVKETPERLKLLRKAAEADRPALVESWKGADGTTQESDDDWGALGGRKGKPKTSPPKFEGLGADEDLEDEDEETDEPSRKGGKRDLKSYMESLTE